MADGNPKGIEPGACGVSLSAEGMCLLSVAISLRRIADAVDPPPVITAGGPLTPEQVAEIRDQWTKRFAGVSEPPPDWDSAKGDQPSRLARKVARWFNRLREGR